MTVAPSPQDPIQLWLAFWRDLGFQPIPLCGPRFDGARCVGCLHHADGGCAVADSKGRLSAGKRPLVARWQRSPAFRDDRFPQGCNVGLVMGGQGRWVAVDLDGPAGEGSVRRLPGPAPETLELGTGNGRHLIFVCPPHLDLGALRNRRGVLPGLDVRADGGQVVVAPSVHQSGAVYSILQLRQPALLPDEWYQVLAKVQALPVLPGRSPTGAAPPYVVLRAHRVLQRLRDVPLDGPGHDSIRDAAWALAHLEHEHGALGFDWRTEAVRAVTEEWERPIEAHDARRCVADACAKAEAEGFPTPVPRLVTTGKGQVRPSAANLYELLRDDDRVRLRYDARYDRVVWAAPPPWLKADPGPFDPRPVEEHEYVDASVWLGREHGVGWDTPAVHEAFEALGAKDSFDPVIDHLLSLTWDGTPRVGRWLHTYLGAQDTPYTRAVGQAWLVSAVARADRPGCKADHVLVLEAPQGARKSTAMAVLGGRWFSDAIPAVGDPVRFAESLQGVWIGELAELNSLRRAEAEQVKHTISMQNDRRRPVWGRKVREYPRRCVFVGTTNRGEYLPDVTGNRRFWPVRVADLIDTDLLARDRDQLWAEARDLYVAGSPWHLVGDVANEAAREQEARAAVHPWTDTIVTWLGARKVCVLERVLADAVGSMKVEWGRHGPVVADILIRLGWRRDGKRRKHEGKQHRLWLAPGFDPDKAEIPWDDLGPSAPGVRNG